MNAGAGSPGIPRAPGLGGVKETRAGPGARDACPRGASLCTDVLCAYGATAHPEATRGTRTMKSRGPRQGGRARFRRSGLRSPFRAIPRLCGRAASAGWAPAHCQAGSPLLLLPVQLGARARGREAGCGVDRFPACPGPAQGRCSAPSVASAGLTRPEPGDGSPRATGIRGLCACGLSWGCVGAPQVSPCT